MIDMVAETCSLRRRRVGTDPRQDESVYYEVCDHLRVSRLTSTTVLLVLMARHQPQRVEAAAAARESKANE